MTSPELDPVAAADARLDAALKDQGCRKRLKQATSKTRILLESDERRVRETKK